MTEISPQYLSKDNSIINDRAIPLEWRINHMSQHYTGACFLKKGIIFHPHPAIAISAILHGGRWFYFRG